MLQHEIEALYTACSGNQKACQLGEQAFGREEEGACRFDRCRQLEACLELLGWRKEPAWLGRTRLIDNLEIAAP